MIFLAWRNVARSWGHHGPVALYFGFALALVLVAQGFLAGADRNLWSTYPGALTGDLMVRTTSEPRWTLFGASDSMWGDSSLAPVLRDGTGLVADLSSRPGVLAVAGVVAGPGLVDLGTTRQAVWVFGVEPSTWGGAMPGWKPSQPWDGEPGAFLSPNLADDLGHPQVVKLLFSSGEDFQLVSRPVRGTAGPGVAVAALDHTLWIDAAAARHLFGLEAVSGAVSIDAGEADLINGSESDLFGEGAAAPPTPARTAPQSTQAEDPASGWNFVVVRLGSPVQADALASQWNAGWKAAGVGLEAVTWRQAAGGSSLYVVWLQGLLGVGLVLLFMVGAGSLVNAMTGVVVERASEVGTLRALGASRYRVYRLFGYEALFVVGLGVCGAVAGALAVGGILDVVQLKVANQVFAALTGGRAVQLVFVPWQVTLDVVAVVALAWVATAVPLVRILDADVIRALEGVPE